MEIVSGRLLDPHGWDVELPIDCYSASILLCKKGLSTVKSRLRVLSLLVLLTSGLCQEFLSSEKIENLDILCELTISK